MQMVKNKEGEVDLKFLNSLNLEHLSLGIATNQMLDQLDLKQLRGFKTSIEFDSRCKNDEDDDEISELEEAFVNFLKRHPNLEVFHQFQYLSLGYLKAAIEFLPKLKELKFRTCVESEEQYNDALKVLKLAYKKMNVFSSSVYFYDEDQGKKIMERLLPDVPYTTQKKEGGRDEFEFIISKEADKRDDVSSVDPILIDFRPSVSAIITQNGVFEHKIINLQFKL
jgi:hypothetical protein